MGNSGAQIRKGNFSQTAEVRRWLDREGSLARREEEAVQHLSPLLPDKTCPSRKPVEALGHEERRCRAGIIATHSKEEETEAQARDRLAERPQRQLATELVLDLVCLTPATRALGVGDPQAGPDWCGPWGPGLASAAPRGEGWGRLGCRLRTGPEPCS